VGYVIAAIILVLIVATAVTWAVLSASRRQRQASIAAPDRNTPLGDTDQHADVDQGAAGRPPGGGEGEAEGDRDRPSVPESERLQDRGR
jgi:hypothetical protein